MNFRLTCVILVFILAQACSRSETKEDKPAKPPAQEEGVSTEVPGQEVEVKVGDDLSSKLSKITVQDGRFKKHSLSSLIDNKESVLILVKPGCVFCESLLAVMNSQKTDINPKVFFVLDAAHTNQEDFKAKMNKNKDIKAEWIYDSGNKFHDELGMNSFPRFLHLDKKQVVVEHQIGLKLPKRKEDLQGQEFPVVLQKLSVNTVDWLKSL